MFKKINEWRLKKVEENEAKLKELKSKPIEGIHFNLQGEDFVVCGLDVVSVMSSMKKSSDKTLSVKNKLTGKNHMIRPRLIKTYVNVTYYPETNTYE